MSKFRFLQTKKDQKTQARVGKIFTPHGVIQTPAFVPVGTQATIKSLTPEELKTIGVQLFFINTYHIYLRPGVGIINKISGLHRFSNWNGPLITDSGGFQVFSLNRKKYINVAISESAVLDRDRYTKKQSRKEDEKDLVYPDDYKPVGELVKIDENGVTFTSHWDGSRHRFTPEKSIEIQHSLGADIILSFDECTSYPTTIEYAKIAMERTHRWAKRSLEKHHKLEISENQTNKHPQALYGIIQGSIFKELRIQSSKYISSMDFDGIAIGGVSVGESKQEMRDVVSWVYPYLPKNIPRHILGVGELDDIFDIVSYGIDTFDCVQPTRLARMGKLYIRNHHIKDLTLNIQKKEFASDLKPIDSKCQCYSCINYSRAYIHHLFRVKELLAYRLATIHNLFFVHDLVRQIRESILEDSFLEFKEKFFENKKT